MDQVNEVRVRDGRIHAERPQILTPEHYCAAPARRIRREGAEIYRPIARADAERRRAALRLSVSQNRCHREHGARHRWKRSSRGRSSRCEHSDEPLSAVIQGVDDAWEVCLLKFTIDLIERSAGGNIGDLRRAASVGLELVGLGFSAPSFLVPPHELEKADACRAPDGCC